VNGIYFGLKIIVGFGMEMYMYELQLQIHGVV